MTRRFPRHRAGVKMHSPAPRPGAEVHAGGRVVAVHTLCWKSFAVPTDQVTADSTKVTCPACLRELRRQVVRALEGR